FFFVSVFAGLGRIARVPIHLTRHVHHDRQKDEESDYAHEQGIILLPQSDIKKRITAGKPGADHQRAHTTAEEKAAIPRNQQRRCNRRDEICPTKSDKFRNRQQQQIKQAKRRADHQILERMNLLSRSDFEEEECRKYENEEEYPILDRALDVAICVQD